MVQSFSILHIFPLSFDINNQNSYYQCFKAVEFVTSKRLLMAEWTILQCIWYKQQPVWQYTLFHQFREDTMVHIAAATNHNYGLVCHVNLSV